jgi:hypothetical protein
MLPACVSAYGILWEELHLMGYATHAVHSFFFLSLLFCCEPPICFFPPSTQQRNVAIRRIFALALPVCKNRGSHADLGRAWCRRWRRRRELVSSRSRR